MALGELPFAIGTIYMGESFLTRNYLLLFGIGIVGAALSWAVFHRAAAMWSSARCGAPCSACVIARWRSDGAVNPAAHSLTLRRLAAP
jgi:hypothetical protein